MVVFPAHTGLAYLAAAHPKANLFLGPGFGAAVVRLFASSRDSGPEADFLRVFSRLASHHHVFLAPGTFPVPATGGVRNVAHLLSDQGVLIGVQAQTHLSRDERASGFVRSEDLEVFETPIGTVGFAICEDAWYPEVARILALLGAKVLLAPVAVPAPYTEWHQVRGMWQNVQQNQVFGVEACLVGLAGGVEFEGRSAVYATCEMTEEDTGVLARATRTTAESVIVADLSFASMRDAIELFPVFRHFNVDFYRTWLPRLYRATPCGVPRSARSDEEPSSGLLAGARHGRHAEQARLSGNAGCRSRRAAAAAERLGAIDSVRVLALRAFLRWASRPSVVRGYLSKKRIASTGSGAGLSSARGGSDSRGAAPGTERVPKVSKVRVAAVQMRLELTRDAKAYAEKIYGLTKEAVDQGAELVVFPEGSGAPLLGLVPGVEKLASKGLAAAAVETAGTDVLVAELFRVISPAVKRIYETTFSTLARDFQVYIITGSAFLEDDDGKMRIIGYLFGPAGELIARQRKLHLVPMEAAWGFEPGSDLEVLDTPLGRLAFPICMDATYFETFRIARQRGVDIVAVPSANNEEFLFWRVMRGIWPRVQESQVLGVSAAAVGNILGMPFTGMSGLLAPLEMTSSGDGWLARASSSEDEEVVVGDLDLDALRRFRDENALDFNVPLYEKHLPDAYDRVRLTAT
jgi:predicted amidohydrolase